MEGEKKKTLICFDALNWLDNIFWNNKADLQYCADPWEALRDSDRTVGTFVRAARNADFELVVVIAAGSKDPDVIATYEWRREEEIMHEKRGVCLGADMFLADSFQSHGIRVVRPIDANAIDVLAALADSVEGAVIVSRNRLFFSYDKALLVSRSFTVRGGKLLLESPVTRNNVPSHMKKLHKSSMVQPHLSVSHEAWSLGHVTKYRPSLRSQGRVVLGSSSSTDRKMGNLHVIARPLRAAVYAMLGEQWALERIPEWTDAEKMVVWTETEVAADPALSSVLKDPLSVVEWLKKHDTPVEQVEPWRAAERHFNICALASELVSGSSQGAWTMHKCMELFSNDDEIIKRTSPGAKTSAEEEVRPYTFLDARRHFGERQKSTKTEPAMQHQSSMPNLLPEALSSTEITKNKNENSSRSRDSIFGAGRPREEVLKERAKQNIHL